MVTTLGINIHLLEMLQAEDYAGYDPFDGLNSKIFRSTFLQRFAPIRLAWLQFQKISPINMRPVFGIPKNRNPKGIALIILGLLEDYCRTSETAFLEEARKLGVWLLENSCSLDEWGHYCWGYHFDWQARAFYVPVGTPNIITTCFVVRAMFALAELANEERFLKAGLDAALFIDRTLFCEEDEGHAYYAYIPGEKTCVYNASLWGAAIVAMAGEKLEDSQMLKHATQACQSCVAEQKSNGAWPYGKRSHHQFIDAFHTGYNLEALWLYQQAIGSKEFDLCITKGLDFYRRNFFLQDGTPKYYDNKVYPVDMHSVSQAILTLLKVGGTEKDLELAEKIITWSVENMYLEKKGYFRYQLHRLYKNNICYLRWTQAWVYYSFAFYNRYKI